MRLYLSSLDSRLGKNYIDDFVGFSQEDRDSVEDLLFNFYLLLCFHPIIII